jgi:3-oxoacyl-[acyl-carrier-protein] synthase III
MACLRAFGSYLPVRVVGNEEIEVPLGAEPDWILSSAGIEERRFAASLE